MNSSPSSAITRQSACGFRLSAVLGTGATATVYLGLRDADGNSSAAVKVIDKLKLPIVSRSVLAQEAVALRALEHPSILPLISYADNDTHIAFATKFCANGDLLDLLNHKRGVPERQASGIFEKLADAVAYAHSQGWAHRDIKPENVLLDQAETYLADWGSAVKISRRGQHCIGFAGTDGYAAPEIRDARSYCPFAVDVWSFGATLYVACAAGFPFAQDPERHCQGLLAVPSHLSAELQELLRGCLAPLGQRWTFEQVRQCAWFAVNRASPTLPRPLSRSLVLSRSVAASHYVVPRSPRAPLPSPRVDLASAILLQS